VKIFYKIEKTNYLHGNIIFISFGAEEQKLYHKKPKTELGRQQKKIAKSQRNFFFIFFLKYYIFVYI